LSHPSAIEYSLTRDWRVQLEHGAGAVRLRGGPQEPQLLQKTVRYLEVMMDSSIPRLKLVLVMRGGVYRKHEREVPGHFCVRKEVHGIVRSQGT